MLQRIRKIDKPDIDTPDVPSTRQTMRDTFDLFNPSEGTIGAMYGRPQSWLTDKGVPALGMGIKEALDEAWYLVNLHDDPSLGPDPLTGLPRQRFGFDIFGEQLGRSIKSDFGKFWSTNEMNVLADYQRSRRTLEDAIGGRGLADVDAQTEFPREYAAYQQASQALKARNQAWSEQSLMLGMAKDFVSKYGSRQAFADTLFNRPDRFLVDLADFYTPKLPSGIMAGLRRATPQNFLEVIDDTETRLREQAAQELEHTHYELMNPNKTAYKTLYHGSPEIETIEAEGRFSKAALGGNTGATSAKEGFFFTDNKNVARSYGVDEELAAKEAQKWDIEEFENEKEDIGSWAQLEEDKRALEEQIETLSAEKERLETQIANANPDDATEMNYLEHQMKYVKGRLDDLGWEIDDIDENMKRIDEIDEEIEWRTEEMESALGEFQELELVEVNLIMRNPMVLEAKRAMNLTNTMREAKASGYDGVIIKNLHDPYHTIDPDADYVGTHYIVFEPGQIVNANTGLQMGDATDLVAMMNVAAGRQMEIDLFAPEGITFPKELQVAIEKSPANSHLASMFIMLQIRTAERLRDQLHPNIPGIVNALESMDTEAMIDAVKRINDGFPDKTAPVLEQYRDIIPKTLMDRIEGDRE